MVQQGFRNTQQRTVGLAVITMLCLLVVHAASAVETRQFANGISATIYTPSDILGQMKTTDTGSTIEIQTPNGTVEISGTTDTMVPFDEGFVAAALQDMHGLSAAVDVAVYILPAKPVGVGSSFARQDAIYLAPGTGAVDEGTVAYITTHEMGHVLTWAFMDQHPSRWDAYRQMRGLTTDLNGPLAIHADRAREILAEDIRFLFGGANATWPGSIENHDLALPDRVDGLYELLSGFFADRELGPSLAHSTVFPNPCNPLTTVAMELAGGQSAEGSRVSLRVFDIRGALVRTVEEGHWANNRVSVQWKGMSDNGMAAASGRYVYILEVGDLVARGSITLVR